MTITASNTYLYAMVTVLKVNGKDGSPLDGAAFEAYRMAGGHPMTNPTGEWTELSNGEYRVLLPLSGLAGNTFRIQEVSAPAGYRNDRPYTEVTVRPGDSLVHDRFDAESMTGGTLQENDAAHAQRAHLPQLSRLRDRNFQISQHKGERNQRPA